MQVPHEQDQSRFSSVISSSLPAWAPSRRLMYGVLDEWERNHAAEDDRWLAYMLATAQREAVPADTQANAGTAIRKVAMAGTLSRPRPGADHREANYTKFGRVQNPDMALAPETQSGSCSMV